MQWLHTLNSEPTIRALRSQVSAVRANELERARRRLLAGDDPNIVLDQFAHNLTQKFVHEPSRALKLADKDGNDRLLRAARQLFGLDR